MSKKQGMSRASGWLAGICGKPAAGKRYKAILYAFTLLAAAPALASSGGLAGEQIGAEAVPADAQVLPFLVDHDGFTLAALTPSLAAELPPVPAGPPPTASGGEAAAIRPQAGPSATERERVRRIRRETMRVEVAYHVASLIDGIATNHCLRKQTCREVNPIYGSNPSTLRVFGTKLAFGAVHHLVVLALLDRDPGFARGFAYVSLVLQGGVTGLTLSRAY